MSSFLHLFSNKSIGYKLPSLLLGSPTLLFSQLKNLRGNKYIQIGTPIIAQTEFWSNTGQPSPWVGTPYNLLGTPKNITGTPNLILGLLYSAKVNLTNYQEALYSFWVHQNYNMEYQTDAKVFLQIFEEFQISFWVFLKTIQVISNKSKLF